LVSNNILAAITSMVHLGGLITQGMNPKKSVTSIIHLALVGLHIVTLVGAVVDNGGSVRGNSVVGGDVERDNGVVAGDAEADNSSGNTTLEHLPDPQAGFPTF
jgi:hypothetical protein